VKALLQRVTRASVTVEGRVTGEIGPGLAVLAGVAVGDTLQDVAWLAEKTANLRIFNDAEGKFNLSVLETGGAVLVVSQFTLLADARRGRRPSFTGAAPPEQADALIGLYVERLRGYGLKVETGVFRAHMEVEIHNHGPVTVMLDSREKFPPTPAP
jgi:D-tyrosyl-tRNA(Tyr) deacylase